MDATKFRVLIADDDAILRCAVMRLLCDVPEIAALGEAANVQDTMELLRCKHWDVLLLDLDMPGQSSLDVLKWVKAEHPDVAVLVLSMYPEEQFGLRALMSGAAGYLNKAATAEHLVDAIRRVGEGGAYISSSLAIELARRLHTHPVDTLGAALSDRELTVLRGIASGRSISEMARELNLSAKTISTYRTRVLTRLNLRSNIELARYATEHGLLK